MRIAVISGGRSSEHDVSLRSGESVRDGLAQAGHEVVDVRIARDGTWSCEGGELVLRPGRGLLDAAAAFPVLHGPFGEDGTLQGTLETLDVPYVGSGVLASAVGMDKIVSKDLMARAGLPQVDYVGLSAPDAGAVLSRLGLPVFVKPSRLGSSVGIAKVVDEAELEPALRQAFRHDPRVIAEAVATGMEVECSVLGNDEPCASEPGEIVIGSDWYDYEAKYQPGGMELVVPARITPAQRERVRSLALEAFRLCGCSGLARADFFVEGDAVLLNELNTMPGQTRTSVYGKLWEATGIPYPDLLSRLVDLALERHASERFYAF